MERFIHGHAVIRELTPRTPDHLASFGEHWSSLLLTHELARHAMLATLVDAIGVMMTDQEFARAAPLFDQTESGVQERLLPLLPHVGYRHGEDFVYGRGACDAKGIIAARIKAVEQLRSQGSHETALLFAAGEESGSDGARAANTTANPCRFLIDGEPTENKLALGSQGALRLELKTTGRAAHAACPEQGASAILKLPDLLQELRTMALPVIPCTPELDCRIAFSGLDASVAGEVESYRLLLVPMPPENRQKLRSAMAELGLPVR